MPIDPAARIARLEPCAARDGPSDEQARVHEGPVDGPATRMPRWLQAPPARNSHAGRIAEKPALPLERMRGIEPRGSSDAGDRVLQLFRPPIFDGPTRRGLFDPTTAAMWIVDTFACLTPGSLDAQDLPPDLLEQNLAAMHSAVSPWHAWLDRAAYGRHLDALDAFGAFDAFGARTVASAHGPVLRDGLLDDGCDRLRGLAGAPILPTPGQELLDTLIATTPVEAAA